VNVQNRAMGKENEKAKYSCLTAIYIKAQGFRIGLYFLFQVDTITK